MLLFWIAVVLIPLVDQISKFQVRSKIIKGTQLDTFIPFLKIVNESNGGMAFGIMKGKTLIFIFATTLIILFLFYLLLNLKNKSLWIILGIAFLIGGGIGNLIDRLILGYVTDYLKITFFPPVCNLSDYFVCLGVFILLFNFWDKKSLTKM